MDYTAPSNEIVAEGFTKGKPTKGQEAFAGKIVEAFESFVESGLMESDDYAWHADYALEDKLGYMDAAELLTTYRNVTGESTEDTSVAWVALYTAGDRAWDVLANDYRTFAKEKA